MFNRMYGRASAFFFALLATFAGSPLFGQAGSSPPSTMPQNAEFDLNTDLVQPMLMATAFTILGVILFAVCIWLVVKICPFSVRKEIEEDQNTALGIIIGSMILGVAIILAAAIAF